MKLKVLFFSYGYDSLFLNFLGSQTEALEKKESQKPEKSVKHVLYCRNNEKKKRLREVKKEEN